VEWREVGRSGKRESSKVPINRLMDPWRKRRRRRSHSYSMMLYPGFESLAAPWALQKGSSNLQKRCSFLKLSVQYCLPMTGLSFGTAFQKTFGSPPPPGKGHRKHHRLLLPAIRIMMFNLEVSGSDRVPAFGVCVYYCSIYKAVREGGGGKWRTCATRDYEPSLCQLVCPSRTSAGSVTPLTLHNTKVEIFFFEATRCPSSAMRASLPWRLTTSTPQAAPPCSTD